MRYDWFPVLAIALLSVWVSQSATVSSALMSATDSTHQLQQRSVPNPPQASQQNQVTLLGKVLVNSRGRNRVKRQDFDDDFEFDFFPAFMEVAAPSVQPSAPSRPSSSLRSSGVVTPLLPGSRFRNSGL